MEPERTKSLVSKHKNHQEVFWKMQKLGKLCDVSLVASEGETIRVHQLVLCASSNYFANLLLNRNISDKEPYIILRDVPYAELECCVEFMYKGETTVKHRAMKSLLKTAEALRISGLIDKSFYEFSDIRPDSSAKKDGSGSAINGTFSVQGGRDSSTSSAANCCREPSSVSIRSPHTEHIDVKSNEKRSSSSESSSVELEHNSCSSTDNTFTNYVDNNIIDNASSNNNAVRLVEGCGLVMNSVCSLAPLSPLNQFPLSSNDREKKKRGRPPLDEGYNTFQPPVKQANVTLPGHASPNSSWLDPVNVYLRGLSEMYGLRTSISQQNLDTRSMTPSSGIECYTQHAGDANGTNNATVNLSHEDNTNGALSLCTSASETVQQTSARRDISAKFSSEFKQNRKPKNFWNQKSTLCVLEAIKSHKLDMKKASTILDVKYGTLYGRYRDRYGNLKESSRYPLMVKEDMQDMSPPHCGNYIDFRDRLDGVSQLYAAKACSSSTSAISSCADHVSTKRELPSIDAETFLST